MGSSFARLQRKTPSLYAKSIDDTDTIANYKQIANIIVNEHH